MKRFFSLAICSVLLISLMGCGDKAEDVATTSITVAQVSSGDVNEFITYTGTIRPKSEVAVIPKASGRVTAVHVKLGDTVQSGDVLYTLDNTDQALAVRQAQAALENARAAYQMSVGGAAQQSIAQLEQALSRAELEAKDAAAAYERVKTAYDNNTTVTAAQVAYDSAKLNFERTQQLYDKGGVSRQVLESAENQYKTAEAQLSGAEDSAKLNLDSAKSRMDNAQVALAAARENLELTQNVVNPQNAKSASAQVSNAQAALEIAQQALANTTVTAPISGQVSAVPMGVGDMIGASSSPVMLVNLNAVEIDIKVAEKNISSVYVGMPAFVSVSSAGLENVEAYVAEVSPAANAQTGMFDVKIYIENPQEQFRAGMFADIRLVSGSSAAALTVPTLAIKEEGDRTYVFVVNGDKLEERDVTLGIEQGEVTEIKSGLTAGETVVVQGKDFVTEESKFRIVEQ